MVIRTIIRLMAEKRVPMIKFRSKGGATVQTSAQASAPSTLAIKPDSTLIEEEPRHHPSAIEDWELPVRFQRKPIDLTECAFINRGGPPP